MKKITILIATLVLAAGCFPDDRNNYMVDDSFCLTATTQLQQASVHTGSCTLGVAKNGKGQTAASARISTDPADYESALKLFNIKNGTAYKAIPSDQFTIEGQQLDYLAEEVVKDITLRWNPASMAAFIGDDTDYVIPLRLVSDTPGVQVNGEHSFIMVRLARSGVRVSQQTVARSIERKAVEPDASGAQRELQETIVLDLVMSNPVKGLGLSFPVEIDNSLIDAFNEGLETPYAAAPDGLVTLLDQNAVLPEGNSSATFKIQLDKSKLLKDGKLQDFPPYVVPVRVKESGMAATLNGEPFEMGGLAFGNMVTYVTVARASSGIAAVNREWGLYSITGAWYEGLPGFAANSDRTIAMDDDFVYVAHSNGTPAIYALSRTSGAFVKQLDITPAIANGCTYPVSCVRMIPNPGGKDILAFCSLKADDAQHLFIYAYANGTDAAPVQILDYLHDNAGGANDWRRYGDRFTVEGNWQEGTLWFSTWSDGAKCKILGFSLRNGVITNPEDPVDYFMPSEKSGIKDVVRYPNWDNFLITRTSGATVFKPGPVDGDTGWTQLSSIAELPELALTYGYNLFNFHGKDFVAFMRLESENGNKGRLVIIEDNPALPAEFPNRLKIAAGALEFPIQHPDSFEEKSALTASHSVGDCCIREIDGNTYIAVLMQGCGLSLFQLQ